VRPSRNLKASDSRSLVPPVVIPNPILNAPYDEPTRHFRFGDEGITDELVEERRRRAGRSPSR
jgi:type III restriction enzyme